MRTYYGTLVSPKSTSFLWQESNGFIILLIGTQRGGFALLREGWQVGGDRDPWVLGPPKKVAFWTGKWDPLFQGKSRWWWNIHYNLARCNVRKGHKTWGWLSWAVVSYVSHSCSVWDSHWIPSLGCIKRHQMYSMWIRSFLLFETAIRSCVGDLFLKNSNRIHDPQKKYKMHHCFMVHLVGW